MVWQRSGDPLGDMLRLMYILEEGLERLGASESGTLGEKLREVERVLPRDLVVDLWEVVQIRNQIIHARREVPKGFLESTARLLARFLALLERQGYYTPVELAPRLKLLEATPPPLPLYPVEIAPTLEPPQVPQRPRPLEHPRRFWSPRPLRLPWRP